MAKANKFNLVICLMTFCLFLLLFSSITKNTHPQDMASVPALVEAFKDKSADICSHAVIALENIVPKAIAADPAIIEAFKDPYKIIRGSGMEALGKIATARRDAESTDMIKDLKTAKEVLFAYSGSKEQENAVRRKTELLEQVKTPLWGIVRNLAKENILISALILAYLLWVIIWLIVFWLRPIALLKINLTLKLDIKLPAKIGSITLPLNYLLFVGVLHYRPRVLNAWVKSNLSTGREKFSENPTVLDRQIHISVPVEFDRQAIPDFTPKELRPTFARQVGCLLVWGEGGSGKTSLVCQIAKWAMSEDKEARFCEHLMLPVLIEQELKSSSDKNPFISAIARQLQLLIDQPNPIPVELIDNLLRRRRVLVIVDHLSEMSSATRAQIKPEQKDFPVNALIVTSRLEEALGGVAKTLIKPLRVSGNQLSSFLHTYLTERGTRDQFDDPEFFNACRRLSEMVGDRDITLLLAKLYAEQLIATKEGFTDDRLPDNIPDLMLRYLNDQNRSIKENRIDDLIIHKIAKVLAWESLKEKFRPAYVRIDHAIAILDDEETQKNLKYLEDRLRLFKTDPVSKDRFKFLLDPFAEYLAGLHLLGLHGDNKESWINFLADADRKEGALEAIKGFLLAVRDCIIAKGEEAKIPNFVADELAKRAGLDPNVLVRAQLERRIQHFTNQLSLPQAEDRFHAAEALGEIGPEAKGAAPALSETLKDKDINVRKEAAWTLAKIGREAVPALIEALKDENQYVRQLAAQALSNIGPEAKEAVPALIKGLKDENEYVRQLAAQGLSNIGPEAKEAVPALIKALKDKNIGVRRYVAEALGNIGPETVRAFIEALKDQDEYVRRTAYAALKKISTPEALNALEK